MSRCMLFFIAMALVGILGSAHDASLPKPHTMHELGQHRVRRMDKRALLDGQQGAELTPLFPGYGTHFSYAYVGTPPQRQSLIVDTGSHYTAFPCVGCVKCGKHTDSFWDPEKSSTKVVPQCQVGTTSKKAVCEINQAYSEGSSWKAYRVQDKLWVGGISPELVPKANNYTIDFEFGCQSSATGLFVTQLADGIMGMSNGPDTLPAQLKAKKVSSSGVFALCFRIGGGIMTLGGVDQRIHTKRSISYAANSDSGRNGWFSVNVRNILLRAPNTQRYEQPISLNASYLAGAAAGAIIDSGTTDTYLPAEVFTAFKEQFAVMSGGLKFQEKDWKLSKEDLKKLPTIVFRIQATGAAAAEAALKNTSQAGATIDVQMAWPNYLDKVGEDLYTARIGFTEKEGALVLGSNFMTGYNVIFDPEQARIGFAASTCNYEEFDPLTLAGDGKDAPALAPTTGAACTGDDLIPTSQCTALCQRNETAYISKGTQQWKRRCDVVAAESAKDPAAALAAVPVQEKDCQEGCNGFKIVRGDPACPDRAWTDCTHGCVKSRQTVPTTGHLKDSSGHCNYRLQTSTCYAGICPLEDGDYLVYIDLRVRLDPARWSYVHSESFFAAMAAMFKLNVNTVELLNDAGNEYTQGTKLHFKIRLKAKDYKDVTAMHYASDRIVMAVRAQGFGSKLVQALDLAAGRTSDKGHLSRFGWMFGSDIEVLSAIAMPTSGVRAPQGEEGSSVEDEGPAGLTLQQTNLLLLGVALAAVLILAVVIYMHMRLRQAHALYEKDKGTLSQGSRALHKMFNAAAQGIASVAGVPAKDSLAGGRDGGDVEMSSMGLMEAPDEDLED